MGRVVMSIKLISVGFSNFVNENRVVAVVSPESAPIKRTIADAKANGVLINATCGRRTRAVAVTDSGHVILSALHPGTLSQRFISEDGMQEE
jgi:regulator of extracellular matrix RemA (YlzA/DUF370 family)